MIVEPVVSSFATLPTAVLETYPMSVPVDPPTGWYIFWVFLGILFLFFVGAVVLIRAQKKKMSWELICVGICCFLLVGDIVFSVRFNEITCKMSSSKFELTVMNNGTELIFKNLDSQPLDVDLAMAPIQRTENYYNIYSPKMIAMTVPAKTELMRVSPEGFRVASFQFVNDGPPYLVQQCMAVKVPD